MEMSLSRKHSGARMAAAGAACADPSLPRLLTWALLIVSCLYATAQLSATAASTTSSAATQRKTYIVHMDHSLKPDSYDNHESWHRSAVASKAHFIYSYQHAMHGFSARLTLDELEQLQKLPGHVAANPESSAKLFTTHTTQFLGLNRGAGLWPVSSYGQGSIVGVIDTGVWPESRSFNDSGMPPVPSRWKGECQEGEQFSHSLCNKKLIGARYFSRGMASIGVNISVLDDYNSTRDFYGHGTHTSSTAAGNYVTGAGAFGYAEGTARGVAPASHVAMYKVLWLAGNDPKGMSSDVLAGMDQAIADGVDVMSISLGWDISPYYEDSISIAALSAVERGITVVCAAGNDGRTRGTTYNAAPWIITVGAGTVDRRFVARLKLGNGVVIEGTSYFPEGLYVAGIPLFYGSDDLRKAACLPMSLNSSEVKGKVVLCDGNNQLQTDYFRQKRELKRVGAKAAVINYSPLTLDPEDYDIPVIVLEDGAAVETVRAYATQQQQQPTVSEMKFQITEIGGGIATPQVAYFSSRGPDRINPGVLKPDILAPGKDVLAAWVPNKPVASVGSRELVSNYTLASGTSMATPHVAGVVALLKSVHRDWSPVAIRSALMTTATVLDNRGQIIRDEWNGMPATPLDFGAGHVNPNKAMDPGLIYNMGMQDYINFLCGLGYNVAQMSAVLRRSSWTCDHEQTDLNYPSFTVLVSNTTTFPLVRTFKREVTNVADQNATYSAVFQQPEGLKFKVEPDTLVLSSKGQKQQFTLTVEVDQGEWSRGRSIKYGFLQWLDGKGHVVSSPIVAVYP